MGRGDAASRRQNEEAHASESHGTLHRITLYTTASWNAARFGGEPRPRSGLTDGMILV